MVVAFQKRSLLTSRLLLSADVLAVIAMVMIFSINIWLITETTPRIWVNLIADDGYYYLGIVRNLVEHRVSSFLPPYETNGYQPLWTVLLSVTASLFGTEKERLMLECYGLSVVFIVIFVVLSKIKYGSAFPAIVVSIWYQGVTLLGMETVAIPATSILFFTSKTWVGRGVFGSILFLERLDALSLVVARDIYFLVTRREIDPRPYLIIVPVIAVYCALNVQLFGTPLPVSGLIKSLHSVILENWSVSIQYISQSMRAVFILAIFLLISVIAPVPFRKLKFVSEIIVCAIATALCALYYGVNSGWPLWAWYFWGPLLLAYYVLLESVEVSIGYIELGRPLTAGLVNGAILLIIGLTGGLTYVSSTVRLVNQARNLLPIPQSYKQANLDLADWVKQSKIPPGTMLAMGDRAGSFGFFLGDDYSFLHTEGLVGPLAYYSAMKNDQAIEFINQANIKYWIADREAFLEAGDILGVVEPVQGLSMHRGPYMICFNKSAIVRDMSYIIGDALANEGHEHRLVFDMEGRVACPAGLQEQFVQLRDRYSGLRDMSLPQESELKGRFNPTIKRWLHF